jgi:hypothetical protein
MTDNTHRNADPVPDDKADDHEFIKAALLVRRMWDLDPESRPVIKQAAFEARVTEEPAEQPTHNRTSPTTPNSRNSNNGNAIRNRRKPMKTLDRTCF